MGCPGSFPSSYGENHTKPQLGWEVDSDKPGCTRSCRGDVTNPTFLHAFFWILVPDPRFLQPTLES